MKKSTEIIAAGTSLVSAAAMANVTNVMERMKQAGASQYLTKESAAGQLCSAIVGTMSTAG